MGAPVDPFRYRELQLDGAAGQRGFAIELDPGCCYFDGHFPEQPILPAVAQLDILMRLVRHLGWPQATATAVNTLRLLRSVGPEAHIELHLDALSPGRPTAFRFVEREETVSQGILEWNEHAP